MSSDSFKKDNIALPCHVHSPSEMNIDLTFINSISFSLFVYRSVRFDVDISYTTHPLQYNVPEINFSASIVKGRFASWKIKKYNVNVQNLDDFSFLYICLIIDLSFCLFVYLFVCLSVSVSFLSTYLSCLYFYVSFCSSP